ncbi:Alpha/Beta hydrolase protein [Mycena vulgaris]|nr:Alpha/Beta hydrolase protein [Mycena vulgaris]
MLNLRLRLSSRKFCGKESIDQEVVTADLRGHGRSGRPTSPDADQSKIFVDDFKTVMDAFGLGKPILAAWSMGAAVATDVAAHLPPATLSGVIYLAGVPSTGEMMSPTVGAALSGLLSTDDVFAFQASSAIFAEKLFAQPDTVPYATKCLYMGHRLPPEIIKSSLDRPMDLQPLWTAGR